MCIIVPGLPACPQLWFFKGLWTFFQQCIRAQEYFLVILSKFLSSVCYNKEFEQKENLASVVDCETHWAGTVSNSVFSTWFPNERKMKQFHFWLLEFLIWREIRFSLEVGRKPHSRSLKLNLKHASFSVISIHFSFLVGLTSLIPFLTYITNVIKILFILTVTDKISFDLMTVFIHLKSN